MTIEQAKAFIAKYPNAKNYVRQSHLEELSPLYEVHIEAVEVTRDDFHSLQGGVLYPRKETTDRFGNAAGISFADTGVSTRKDGGAFVGRAVPQELGPDGKMLIWNAAEYEFDPETKAEIDVLSNKKKGEHKYDKDIDVQLLKLNYKKVARRRADTGARAAAVISAIGMSTGFRAGELFPGNTKTVTFLFSRVIVNSKNELVLNKALESMFNTAGSLYGPQVVAQITGEVATPATPTMRNVSPGAVDADDDFDPDGAGDEPTIGEDKARIWKALEEYEAAYSLPTKAAAHIAEYREDLPGADEAKMGELLDWLKGWEERQKGAAS